MKIRITAIIPASPLRESETMRRALIGAVIHVDTPAVATRRERHPRIGPRLPDTYEATLEEVQRILIALKRVEAAVDWQVVQPYLVRIPHDCAEVVEA